MQCRGSESQCGSLNTSYAFGISSKSKKPKFVFHFQEQKAKSEIGSGDNHVMAHGEAMVSIIMQALVRRT